MTRREAALILELKYVLHIFPLFLRHRQCTTY